MTAWACTSAPFPIRAGGASHGCVRLPRAVAKRVYQTVTIGTPVTIIESEGPTEQERLAQESEQGKGFFGRLNKRSSS